MTAGNSLIRAVVASAVLPIALLASGPALAATLQITHTGTIRNGTDHAGLTGVPGADLAGLSYSAVYEFTFPKSGATLDFYPDINAGTGEANYYYGSGFSSPGRAWITISGTTFELLSSSNSYSFIQREVTVDDDIIIAEVSYRPDGTSLSYGSQVIFQSDGSSLGTADIDAPFYLEVPEGSLTHGYGFAFFIHDFAEGQRFYAEGGGNDAASISQRTIVPEPATWVLMIAGFGLAGAALRRRGASMAHGPA